jgi:hypothetical protein
MNEPALVVSQSGGVTDGLVSLVSARGYEPVTTLVTDRPEHGEYYLSPATVERIEQRSAGSEQEPLVVVDGAFHPGQAVDLGTRLRSVTLRDKRSAVWEHLSESNPVAAARFELRKARLERREAAKTQRDGATQSPSGTSGHLAARDQQVQQCQARLETRQKTARQRVRTGYAGVDGRVVLLGRVGAPTTTLWTALTDEAATPVAGRPAQPTTATMRLGPHTLAVTDTPGIPGSVGLPTWLTEAVPGLPAALEQATCVLGVGDRCESLGDAVGEQFDVSWRVVEPAAATPARDALGDLLETIAYAVRLPYEDAAHALVSDLHDRAAVHATEYDDAIYLRVEVAQTWTGELRRRTAAAGGELQPLDAGE